MVLQALQLQTPLVTAASVTALSRITVNDFDTCFFIFVIVFYIVKHYIQIANCSKVGQDTSLAVLRFGAHMDTDTCTFRDVLDLRESLFEFRRPCPFERVCSRWDEEVGVFKRWIGEGAFSDRECECAIYRFSFLTLAD